MASRVLDSRTMKPLQPATSLWKEYDPAAAPHAFKAETAPEARRWQRTTRRALAGLLRLEAGDGTDPAPRRIEVVDKGDYLREKVVLRTGPHSRMPVYLLLPKGAEGPLPSVVAFHGHGYGVRDIVGLWEDGGERDVPDGYHKDFGVALCRAGFAVAAPEISGFGERQTDFSYLEQGQGAPSTCAHMAFLAFHLGTSAVGIRVRDGLRLVDYLEGRPEFDTGRLGAMGISGGGMHTLFSTCIDERIRACVVSGYFDLPGEHPGHAPLPLQLRAGPGRVRRDARPGRSHRPPADAGGSRHPRSDLPDPGGALRPGPGPQGLRGLRGRRAGEGRHLLRPPPD